MPAAYPKELPGRCRGRCPSGEMRIKQVARDFGIAESCLRNWLGQDDVEAGTKPGVTKVESEDLKALKRRNRELEMGGKALRGVSVYLSHANLEPGQSPQ